LGLLLVWVDLGFGLPDWQGDFSLPHFLTYYYDTPLANAQGFSCLLEEPKRLETAQRCRLDAKTESDLLFQSKNSLL
jgi:hypothetical protein